MSSAQLEVIFQITTDIKYELPCHQASVMSLVKYPAFMFLFIFALTVPLKTKNHFHAFCENSSFLMRDMWQFLLTRSLSEPGSRLFDIQRDTINWKITREEQHHSVLYGLRLALSEFIFTLVSVATRLLRCRITN